MRRTVSELTCWVRSFYASFFPWRTSLTERWSRPSWELGIRGLSSLLLCSSGYCVYCIQCTMCTFWNTILLYPKLPCICYRGIIKFHCIFAGSWRFMPQIFYMIQGNNWGKITNLEFETHENWNFSSFSRTEQNRTNMYVDWYNKWQILRYVPACSVRLNRYSRM